MFLTYDEAAELLRLTVPTVRQYVKRAGLPRRGIQIRATARHTKCVLLFEDFQVLLKMRVGTIGDGSEVSRLLAKRLASNSIGGKLGTQTRWSDREVKRRSKIVDAQLAGASSSSAAPTKHKAPAGQVPIIDQPDPDDE